MTADQITKLYRFMTEQFTVINEKLDQKANSSDIYNILDTHEGRIDRLETEYAAVRVTLDRINSRLDSMDHGIRGIAQHVGYKM